MRDLLKRVVKTNQRTKDRVEKGHACDGAVRCGAVRWVEGRRWEVRGGR